MSDFKVGIIGLGHVGAHVLYTLALQGLADDFLLVDLEEKKEKLTSERQDVLDSMEFLPHKVSVRIGEIEDLGDRNVIINAVGDIAALKGTGTRLMELEFNSKAIRSYADRLRDSGFNGILINISNPCDVIKYKRNCESVAVCPKVNTYGMKHPGESPKGRRRGKGARVSRRRPKLSGKRTG